MKRKATDGEERSEGGGAGRKTRRHIPLGEGTEYDSVAPHYGWTAEAFDLAFWALLYFPPSAGLLPVLLLDPRLGAVSLISLLLSKSQNASWIDTLSLRLLWPLERMQAPHPTKRILL